MYRRPVFNDAMPTITENTIRGVYAELVEFNSDADHAVRREYTGVCVRAPMRAHLWPPSSFAVSCGRAPLSIIKQHIDRQSPPL
jgi:putative transposase